MFAYSASISPKPMILIILLFVLQTFNSLSAQTYTVGNASISITNYSSSVRSGSAVVRVSRTTSSGSLPFYLLISDATLDHLFEVGTRRLYRLGDINDSSLRIYVYRSSSGSIEIGTTKTLGTVVASGTINNKSTFKDVTIYAKTGTGRVPSGSYSNSFSLQLYTGATSPPGGTLAVSGVGKLDISAESITYSAMTISLANSTISFGSALAEGGTPEVQTTFTVTAPDKFSISVNSKNHGYLKLSDEDYFPYSLYFNGATTPVDLSGGLTRLVYSTSAVTDVSYSLRFTAGPLDFLLAGTYSDVLSITFTSQ
jgi:hypothetical protein